MGPGQSQATEYISWILTKLSTKQVKFQSQRSERLTLKNEIPHKHSARKKLFLIALIAEIIIFNRELIAF